MKRSSGKFKVAAYIRVSTEEQAENPEGSIKNQEQRLREYVKLKNSDGPFGEITEVYCDPGISAKDMNRPALQRMLSAIRSGEVNLVLVTEISRLSRAMRDFTELWDFLKEHDCEFQSLRDNFDTTTPAGEMILFTLANFAQFERKQLGERISNAFQARAKRGLWNGGVLPLGYDLNPEKPGHLQIVENEAEIVRTVYEAFLREETLSRTGKVLNEKGVKLPKRPRNGGSYRHSHFTIDALYRILTNRAYIGRRVFKTKDGAKEVAATWASIIDESRFSRVQELLRSNKSRKKPATPSRYPYLLSGLAICKTCGDRMSGKSAHGNGGKIGYYEHAWATKTQSCLSKKVFSCEPHRILAKKIEPVVWADVKRLLSDKGYAQLIFEEAGTHAQKFSKRVEIEKAQSKIAALQNQIEATTERVSELPKGINASVFFDQILRLQKAKEEYEVKLSAIKAEEVNFDSPLNVDEFSKFTSELKVLATKTTDPNVQASICRKLIKKVEVSTTGITIHYHVGDHHFENEFGRATKATSGCGESDVESSSRGSVGAKPAGPFFISRPLAKYRRSDGAAPRSDFFIVDGSNSLTNGRQSHLSPEYSQPHKFIEISGAERRRISAHLVELYRSGLSLTEVAQQTGQPQTTVRTILLRAGIELRPAVSVPFARALRESGKRNILPYFGFCYFQGKVVPDQREYGHLNAIYNLWKKGMNPNAIASHLNSKKVPPRSASAWNRNSVVNILKRFETGAISQKGGRLELR